MKTKVYLNKETKELVLALNGTKALGNGFVELKANTTDGAREKHVPNVEMDGDKVHVKVGSARHPMLDEHYIQFILLETTDMAQVKYLKPNDEPEATFVLNGKEKPVAVYEYCNLHGLWKYEFNLDLSSRK